MPVLRLDQASEVWVGGKRASEVWIAGNRVWTPPPSASLLMLNATPAYLSFFTIQSATPSSIILNGQNTARRVASWSVPLKVGDVVKFTYTCDAPLHCRTSAATDLLTGTDALIAGVNAASPRSVSFKLSKDAPYFGFLFGSGTMASNLSVTDFSITRPV